MRIGTIPALFTVLAVLAVPVLAKDDPAAKGADANAPSGPQPKLAIASLEHDFGTLKPGTPLEYRFEVKNDGKADLVIESVKAACGCTTASFDSIVAPGKTGGITLVVKKTDSYKGKFSKGAAVHTNDPEQASFRLTLVADFATE